jgi:hypothetical protein
LPFGIAQIGKSFRNEITPGNFTFRTREFEQMEIEFFVLPGTDEEWHQKWIDERFAWYPRYGIRKENIRLREHEKDELAHYAKRTADIGTFFLWMDRPAHRKTAPDLILNSTHGKRWNIQRRANKRSFYVIEPSAGRSIDPRSGRRVSRGRGRRKASRPEISCRTGADQIAVPLLKERSDVETAKTLADCAALVHGL